MFVARRYALIIGRIIVYRGTCRENRPHFSSLPAVDTASESASRNSEATVKLRSEWARREQYRLDGIRYDVYVASHNGGCRGVWVCLDCGEHGSSRPQDSIDKASAKAQLALCAHHNQQHRPVRKPR
jgi:hypothetical protein